MYITKFDIYDELIDRIVNRKQQDIEKIQKMSDSELYELLEELDKPTSHSQTTKKDSELESKAESIANAMSDHLDSNYGEREDSE
jgi:membrane protease subunit (stomatin/prohibitin family)